MPSRILAASFIAAAFAAICTNPMSVFADEDQAPPECRPDLGCSGIPGVFDELGEAASLSGVEPINLLGALNQIQADTGVQLHPKQYLYATGELEPPYTPPPPRPAQRATSPAVAAAPSSAVIECIVRRESGGDPKATNASGHKGLGQFADSTWASTPQGKTGKSVYDPVANRQAIAWMLSQNRGKEFTSGCT